MMLMWFTIATSAEFYFFDLLNCDTFHLVQIATNYITFLLIAGLLSWDAINCHVNLEEELNTITSQALDGEEGKNGKMLSFNLIISTKINVTALLMDEQLD
jgi:hypothetical protein